MNGDASHSHDSSTAHLESPLAVLPLEELGKPSAKWILTLHSSHLALAESPEARPYIILREDVMKSATLAEGVRALAIKQPKLTLKLSPDTVKALADWIGKPVLGGYYLKRRFGWALPIAALWIIGALPFSGDPDRGMDPIPLDPIGLGLGLVLTAAWAVSKWRPHPALFLVDSLWFAALAVHTLVSILNGWSNWWVILVFLLVGLSVSGMKHFIRFRGTNFSG